MNPTGITIHIPESTLFKLLTHFLPPAPQSTESQPTEARPTVSRHTEPRPTVSRSTEPRPTVSRPSEAQPAVLRPTEAASQFNDHTTQFVAELTNNLTSLLQSKIKPIYNASADQLDLASDDEDA
jgi:hypothetical protein